MVVCVGVCVQGVGGIIALYIYFNSLLHFSPLSHPFLLWHLTPSCPKPFLDFVGPFILHIPDCRHLGCIPPYLYVSELQSFVSFVASQILYIHMLFSLIGRDSQFQNGGHKKNSPFIKQGQGIHSVLVICIRCLLTLGHHHHSDKW